MPNQMPVQKIIFMLLLLKLIVTLVMLKIGVIVEELNCFQDCVNLDGKLD